MTLRVWVVIKRNRQQKSFGRNPAKQCGPRAVAGHRKYLQKGKGHKQVRGAQAHKAGQLFPAPVLPDLQRKGPVRQRSLSGDLTFWLLLGQVK